MLSKGAFGANESLFSLRFFRWMLSREIFYVILNTRVLSVDRKTEKVLTFGVHRKLLKANPRYAYVVRDDSHV